MSNTVNPKNNADSTYNVLNSIVGYQEAVADKAQWEKDGSDLIELKGSVDVTVATLHPKRLTLEVSKVIEETPSTKTIRFISTGAPLPPFQAGQYINLFVDIDGVSTARPYAISSACDEKNYYDLTIKRVTDGFVSNHLLDNVSQGQQFLSTGPMGTFYYNPLFHGEDLVFLAGGSGVAPAITMLKDILSRGSKYSFHMIYCNSYIDDLIFINELRSLAEQYPQFRLTEVVSRPPANFEGFKGHLSADLIRNTLGSIENKLFYVCGPTPFNDYCIGQLKSIGVPNKRIRLEANGAPKNPQQLSDWPTTIDAEEVMVTVTGRGSFKAKIGEPLLNSLERNGYSVENACRSGECSLCRVKVISGNVFNPPEAHLRKSDKTFGWVHSCVAYPTEDIEILF